ncbi:MAG: KamA family radical SAM protein [Proteobacteria bacterium]|nr:KamA family radical SAM protein [Pseudomonadota bacterium]MBU1581511.1 KamA family radical SAM protein [Pseudomonadota bacterium]MBU2454610.1 KamA family radical SAM protein [Pseudomonadota bacterium]MBU2628077.1 KamA family radical SAM protein [Pseudomonadota bacterium]
MNELLQEDPEPPLSSDLSSIEVVLETTASQVQLFKKNDIPTSDFSVINPRADEFRTTFFPQATEKQWNSWRWQIQNSYASFKKLSEFLDIRNIDNFDFLIKSRKLPLRITPYYASLLYKKPSDYALIKSVVPNRLELVISPGEENDPLHEESMCPVGNLVHRYPDRALLLSTGFCSVYCRYCTRSHMVLKDKKHYGVKAWETAIDYIRNNTQIRDVIISGGDPLTMPDKHIEFLLSSLRAIPHVEMIRLGTKVPMVLPQRITKKLVRMLKKYHPFYMSIHATHPDEITPEVIEACKRIADAGIPMGSQTVLLKGVNDTVETMKELMHKLLKVRIRPYYIYQCDPIPGSSHFRTPVKKGLEIIQGLRGFTSGYAVPHYVIDAPGGGGKIPLLPEYYQGREGDNIVLKNFEDKTFQYFDPF